MAKDINNLPSQYSRQYRAIDYDNVMSLYDYHPWEGGNNSRIDRITHTLLNLKKNNEVRTPAVNFFTKVLTNPSHGLSRLVETKKNRFSIVPSHEKGRVSLGLMEIAANVSEAFDFVNTDNLLSRFRTVPKAAHGGPRSTQIHLDSIEVTDDLEVWGETVFLFDDVTSTGSSLIACKKLLLDAGAERVVMVALGQTYLDH